MWTISDVAALALVSDSTQGPEFGSLLLRSQSASLSPTLKGVVIKCIIQICWINLLEVEELLNSGDVTFEDISTNSVSPIVA